MQTFLPYPSFTESAKCLDSRRLGKQRVECLQIVNALTGLSAGWVNHPATVMWRGHVNELVDYAIEICTEWRRRGYKDTLLERFNHMASMAEAEYPKWLGDPAFHDSHKSNLLRKAPFYYSQFNWNVPDNLPYVWPRS
jgi:hypothetical protein